MIISTHFSDPSTSHSAKRQFSDLIGDAVERFESQIRAVQISIRDINGPRGGVDKRCRCVVHLKHMQPIVVEALGENSRRLIQGVSERVSYQLSQKIDRVQKSRRSRRSRRRSERSVELKTAS